MEKRVRFFACIQHQHGLDWHEGQNKMCCIPCNNLIHMNLSSCRYSFLTSLSSCLCALEGVITADRTRVVCLEALVAGSGRCPWELMVRRNFSAASRSTRGKTSQMPSRHTRGKLCDDPRPFLSALCIHFSTWGTTSGLRASSMFWIAIVFVVVVVT